VSAGVVNPVVAYPVILLADIVSDSLYYALGHGGRASIKKMPGRLISKIPTDKFKRIAAALKRNPGKTILFGKWTHVAGIFFLMTAGAARLRFRTFLFYDTLATIPKSLVFFLVGYYSGESIDLIDRYLSYGTLIISGWLILLCILYVVGAKYIEQRFLKID
jgi:membrane protein DedA with SNARE-associated domain